MKSNHLSNLAAQIKTNPRVFADMDEMLLRESILQFHEGKLNESENAEVSALVQSNPHARSILDGILAAERYGESANGKAWLDGLLERVIAETPVAIVPPIHEVFFDRLSDAIASIREFIEVFRVRAPAGAKRDATRSVVATNKDGYVLETAHGNITLIVTVVSKGKHMKAVFDVKCADEQLPACVQWTRTPEGNDAAAQTQLLTFSTESRFVEQLITLLGNDETWTFASHETTH